MVVDPLFPIEPYLLAASTSATPIRLVIDTHLHADHRSAGRALAAAAGADYVIHEQCGSLQCLPSARRGSETSASIFSNELNAAMTTSESVAFPRIPNPAGRESPRSPKNQFSPRCCASDSPQLRNQH